MSAVRCTALPRVAGEGPTTGHRCDAASDFACNDPRFVGRTSASASGRALVPTTPPPMRDSCATRPRPAAPFLAHLIATAQQLPQTRMRRRAEPTDARVVYTATAPAEIGRTLVRSI